MRKKYCLVGFNQIIWWKSTREEEEEAAEAEEEVEDVRDAEKTRPFSFLHPSAFYGKIP